jgi:hypothetical protein
MKQNVSHSPTAQNSTTIWNSGSFIVATVHAQSREGGEAHLRVATVTTGRSARKGTSPLRIWGQVIDICCRINAAASSIWMRPTAPSATSA